MNRKGSDLLYLTIVSLVIVALLGGMLFMFVRAKQGDAGFWETVYARELARVITLAEPGDVITLDVHHATEIAQQQKVADLRSLISIDSVHHRVRVGLRPLGSTEVVLLRDVVVIDQELVLGVPGNVFRFKVVPPSGGGS